MSDEQKKVMKKFIPYIQNRGDDMDIQKWVNLSNFWKILALGNVDCECQMSCLWGGGSKFDKILQTSFMYDPLTPMPCCTV